MSNLINLIDKLEIEQKLDKEEWIALIDGRNPEVGEYLFCKARKIRQAHYGKEVFQRGLIEFTNYCKQDCYYCGIRKSNLDIPRYRLSEDEILSCCYEGYQLGFRTFVLQGGEDGYYSDDRLIPIISRIHKTYPDCAITLSLGERSYESYEKLFHGGARRYLLRHETYNHNHYSSLHPEHLTAANRQKGLWDLKKIGYEVGTGFMVGSPFQDATHLTEDMLFLKELNPQMVGIGPFMPHHNTPFGNQPAGSFELTLFMIGLIRLLLPKVLLPATTSLASIDPKGREKGILAGANVIMPNLSPTNNRKNYLLYDNKIGTEDDAIHSHKNITKRMESIGYNVVVSRGDSLNVN